MNHGVGLGRCTAEFPRFQDVAGDAPRKTPRWTRPWNGELLIAHDIFTLVHELGHVLGIRGGIDGSESTRGHPNAALAADSVMVHSERYCKPTPLDVMAIHALFQTLPRSSS